jgi:hypothetical protein
MYSSSQHRQEQRHSPAPIVLEYPATSSFSDDTVDQELSASLRSLSSFRSQITPGVPPVIVSPSSSFKATSLPGVEDSSSSMDADFDLEPLPVDYDATAGSGSSSSPWDSFRFHGPLHIVAPPPPRRRVRFNVDEAGVEAIPSTSPLDLVHSTMSNRIRKRPASPPPQEKDICSSLWYNITDLEQFRNEARDLSRNLRNQMSEAMDVSCHNNHAVPRPLLVPPMFLEQASLSWATTTRGLEQRSCLERQRRKFIANKCILRAAAAAQQQQQQQRPGGWPERLAEIAQKCTQWAVLVARQEGERDVIRAYGTEQDEQHIGQPELLRPIPPPAWKRPNAAAAATAASLRTNVVDDSEEERTSTVSEEEDEEVIGAVNVGDYQHKKARTMEPDSVMEPLPWKP